MNTLTVKDIRQHLSEAISNAESGEETVITRYGRPIAKLVPIETEQRRFPDMSEFRKSIKLKGKPLSQTVIEMRNEERY